MSLISGSSAARVISVKGSEIEIAFDGAGQRVTVGKLMAIRSASADLIVMVSEMSALASRFEELDHPSALAKVRLLGEIRRDGAQAFRRGASEAPAIGDEARLVDASELQLIYGASAGRMIDIGEVQQDRTIPARIRVDDLVSKHFAVLGTTGVGKSSGVAVILRQILDARPDLRIFVLDSHNEYSRCFGDRSSIVNSGNLKLPFWLFNFEEFVDVVYGGRPPVGEEVEILAELIPIARSNYHQEKQSLDRMALKRADPKSTGYTIDTPVPYLLQDLIDLIDERMGRLDNRPFRMHHHRLISRLDRIRNDPRYDFMFKNANVGGDTMAELLSHLFRLEPGGRMMTIAQLAGLPAEAMDAVVCILMRLAFEFGVWSKGAVPMLFICEEAHRYACSDHSVGFNPTRRALAQIAKEGRKYGVFLGLVTQRPAELDATIISQCSTIFAMRMANDRDQALLRSAVADAGVNLLEFLPSLGTREAIAFGESVPLPVRMTFRELPDHALPANDASAVLNGAGSLQQDFVKSIVERWRGATLTRKPNGVADETSPARLDADDADTQTRVLAQIRERILRRDREAVVGEGSASNGAFR